MKLGLFGINMGPCSTPDASAQVAQAAEAAGFESVWAGEHIVLPDPQEPPSPLPPTYPMLDPNIAFAFLARPDQNRPHGNRYYYSAAAESAGAGKRDGQPGCAVRRTG